MGRTKGAKNKKTVSENENKSEIIQNNDESIQSPENKKDDIIHSSVWGTGENSENNETANANSPGNTSEETKSFSELDTDLDEIDKIIARKKESEQAQNNVPSITGNEEKRGRKSKEDKARAKIRISGYLFSYVNNHLLANVMSLVKIGGTNVPAELLKADEKFLQELAPIGEAAVEYLGLEENPVAAFYIMLGSQAVSNMIQFQAFIKRVKKENPDMDINKAVDAYAASKK